MGVACFHIPPKLLKFNYQYAFAAVHYVETLYKEISQITSPLIISGSKTGRRIVLPYSYKTQKEEFMWLNN